MSKFIPYPFFHDDVPVDISFVFEDEKPAGKHGFLKVDGKHFVFEDGTQVRFWGTNLNGACNFPEKDFADKLACRLAKLGINLVRFHQIDSEWNTPNIFAFTKGRRICSSEFDPQSLDRLDYFISALKREGIYCYMDMFTYRRFKTDEGFVNAEQLRDAGKPFSNYDTRMIELQKELCVRLWTHVNPYTGLAYCDDPVFVMAEIVNESSLFHTYTSKMDMQTEPYRTDFIKQFETWLKENGYSENAQDIDPNDISNTPLTLFKMELQEKYYQELKDCMRSCGVKIPICGTNMSSGSPANMKTQIKMDFLDCHPYLYDWRWGEFEKRCHNLAITQRPTSFLSSCVHCAAADRPTYISEWDMPWPNEFRAESPLYCAAYGMLQDWSGFAIHTYAYSSKLERMQMLGKEIYSEKIGNTPFRQGIFSTWNDPAKFGLFYHAALITRRGDVSSALQEVSIKPLALTKLDYVSIHPLCEQHRVVSDYSGLPFESSAYAENPDPQPAPDTGEVLSDTGEMYRSWKKNYGYIDTPKTKCAYGFLAKNGSLDLSGVTIDCHTDFATIAISSLTEDVITASDNMLLTAVGRAQNTDAKFEGDLMLDYGKPPVLIETIEADITIETEITNLVVWAVSPEGFYIGRLPYTYENGKYSFSIGNESSSMYYLIIKE